MEEQERNYKKDYNRQKEINKYYGVKIPLYLANPLDEKLKKEGKTFTSLVKSAVEKYLKKN